MRTSERPGRRMWAASAGMRSLIGVVMMCVLAAPAMVTSRSAPAEAAVGGPGGPVGSLRSG